jgi:phage internal scaffolding protein
MPTKFHTRYNPPKDVPFISKGVSKAKQQFKDESDINVIVRRYIASGYDPHHISKRQGIYGDFSGQLDLQTAAATIHHAEEEFSRLPAIVRDRFRNDPKAFFDCVNDPEQLKNHAEFFQKAGIMTKQEVKELPKGELSPEDVPPKAKSSVDKPPEA